MVKDMDLINKLKIKDNKLTIVEKKFLDFYLNKEKYPFKNNEFKFMIVKCNIDKDLIRNIFAGLLKDLMIYKCDNYFLFIYQNKEKINIENYIESLSEDIGQMIGIFEGFNINKNMMNEFIKFIAIFEKYYQDIHFTYLSISDLIIKASNNRDEIKFIKKLLFNNFNQDIQMQRLIEAIFKNNLNISKTAKEIYMHRNTVNNKIMHFENKTSLSIQKFKDDIAIYELLKE